MDRTARPDIPCPVCRQPDQVEKVSQLYLEGIGIQRAGRPQPALQDRRLLARRFAPPAPSKAGLLRLIHPDLTVMGFSGVLVFFIAGIWESQRAMLVPALAILAIFFGAYLLQRRKLIATFEGQVNTRKSADRRTERGVSAWMRLYYCARDDVVFEPGKNEAVPASQMIEHLMKQVPFQ